MKIIFVSLLCLIFAGLAFAQTDAKLPEPLQTVGVEEIYLAKDDGEGKAGEMAESFLTTDIPIYCVVQLDSTQPATVKMNFVAVDVKGVKAETKVITVTYKTNGKQNLVNFKGKPESVWTAGSYRIDIFIDGKLAVGKAFEIKTSPNETRKTPAQSDNFIPPKPKPRPKVAKPARKN
jgi:hypothetical protein